VTWRSNVDRGDRLLAGLTKLKKVKLHHLAQGDRFLAAYLMQAAACMREGVLQVNKQPSFRAGFVLSQLYLALLCLPVA
jgi:hypothetical protein